MAQLELIQIVALEIYLRWCTMEGNRFVPLTDEDMQPDPAGGFFKLGTQWENFYMHYDAVTGRRIRRNANVPVGWRQRADLDPPEADTELVEVPPARYSLRTTSQQRLMRACMQEAKEIVPYLSGQA